MSSGVFVTMAMSCSRIGFGVDFGMPSQADDNCITGRTHLKMINGIDQLCIDIGTRPGICRLRVYNVWLKHK